jgi:hypothetical protein
MFCASSLFWVLWQALYSPIGLSEVQITKCEITVSVYILEGSNTRASGIGGYFPQQLMYQDFWRLNSILKEFYCISEAPLNVLKFGLLFITGDLDFPRKQWYSLR